MTPLGDLTVECLPHKIIIYIIVLFYFFLFQILNFTCNNISVILRKSANGGNMSYTRKPVAFYKVNIDVMVVWATYLYMLEMNSQTVVMMVTI